MARWGQISFEDANTEVMQNLVHYHDLTFTLTVVVTVGVLWALGWSILSPYTYRALPTSELIEAVWTLVPGLVLFSLAVPSLSNLYMQDEVPGSTVGLKIVGSQWYWSYEVEGVVKEELVEEGSGGPWYGRLSNWLSGAGSSRAIVESIGYGSFSSYINGEGDLVRGDVYLYDVDKRVVVPVGETVRLIVSSTDVIHSWTILGAGVNVDAIPGRVNRGKVHFLRPGVYYGQCSELCGVNHAFMPIVLEAVPKKVFTSWLQSLTRGA